MATLPSVGVYGLVATPTVSPADPAGGARRTIATLLEPEGANTGVNVRRGVMCSAGFLIAASIFSSSFIGAALAGIVIAKSLQRCPSAVAVAR